jgi:putative ABC transport system permease protein
MSVSPAGRGVPSATLHGWRPALRIARRTARRNLGRTLLIAALVGLPVAGATMVDIVGRTLSSPERDAMQAMGDADARVSVSPWKRLTDWAPGRGSDMTGTGERDATRVDVAALLPRGTRLVRDSGASANLTIVAGRRVVRTTVVALDTGEPLLRHQVRLLEGRAPRGANEVLLSPALADRLGGAEPGSTFTLRDGRVLTVTGLAREPFCLSCQRMVAAPGSPLVRDMGDPTSYLVDLPAGASAESLWRRLAAHGVALTPRDAYLHPGRYRPPAGGGPSVQSLRAVALVAVIAGLGLLEVVLLAGTAFAVGARRQTRELGLVAAAGGTARHVRQIVLAQGLVLGAIGATAGLVAGGAVAIAARPLWELLADGEIFTWAFGPREIAAAALIGLLSGLAAAGVPAVGAGRMRPVDALAERFRPGRRAQRRTASLGLVLVAAGAGCGLLGSRMIAADFDAYTRKLAHVAETGTYLTTPSPTGPVALIVGGAALLVAGIVLLAPAVIGRLAATGARLPVSARLAVRDAARHRHRTGPATSAITVAVAGSVVLAFTAAGTFRAEEAQNVPALPPHVMTVDTGNADLPAARDGARRAAAKLPGGRVLVWREPLAPLAKGEHGEHVDGRELYPVSPDGCASGCLSGPLALAEDRLDDIAAAGELDDDARRALEAGQVVVFDGTLLHRDGTIAVEVSGGGTTSLVRLPAHVTERRLAYTSLPAGLVPAAVAREQGWDTETGRYLVTFSDDATQDDVDAALDAVDQAGAMAFDGSPPDHPGEGLMLAIAGIAGFVTLVGVAISVALSAAEGRADLATLAAVGAAPRRRRALAAFQALVIAGLGCAIGLAGGAFVAYTARATTGSPEFVVPWSNLAVTGLVVPLLAVLVAGAFTPSRLPLARRAT